MFWTSIVPRSPLTNLALMRFRTFFDETGFIDDSDGMVARMLLGNYFLEFVSHGFVISLLMGEEPLHRSGGNFCLEGDGFTVFPWQVGGETVGVQAEIVPCIFVGSTRFKTPEEAFLVRSYCADIRQVHCYALREHKLRKTIILPLLQKKGNSKIIAL